MFEFQLPLPEIFNFDQCLRYLTRSSLECLFTVDHKTVKQFLILDGTELFLTFTPTDDHHLQVTVKPLQTESVPKEAVLQYITDWLDLDRDLTPFYLAMDAAPLVGPMARQFYGLRLVGVPDLFECLCWSVIGQQINLKFAYSLKKRLVEGYGAFHEENGQSFWRFPSPESISQLSPDLLRPLQYSQRKAEYIIGIAQLFVENKINKPKLRQLPYSEAFEQLMVIRGVGAWTADYVLLKCLRHPDAFPIGDAGLHNALKNLMKLNRKPTYDEINQLAANWSGWRGYTTFYLWNYLLL